MNVDNLSETPKSVGPRLESTLDKLDELGLSAYMLTDRIKGVGSTHPNFSKELSQLLDPILQGTFGPTSHDDFAQTFLAVVLTKAGLQPEPNNIEACVTVKWYRDGEPCLLGAELGCFTVKKELHEDTGITLVDAVECCLLALIHLDDDDALDYFMQCSGQQISMIIRCDTGDVGHVALVESLGFSKTNDDWGQMDGIDEVFRRDVIFTPMTPPDSPVGSDTY